MKKTGSGVVENLMGENLVKMEREVMMGVVVMVA